MVGESELKEEKYVLILRTCLKNSNKRLKSVISSFTILENG